MFKTTTFILFSFLLFGCSDNSHATEPSANYVGSQKCASCHAQEHKAWQNSHHDLAMQPATEETVAGEFNNTTFNYFGTVSEFFKKDDQFFVRTDGPDGKLTEYPIAYTFGVDPLQQYLIKFPKGRYQVLSIAWDTRSKQQGGQRWFHLYPDEHIKHNDELHWTGINQNWNFMCADCHSTNLHKNYDLKTREYNTTWSEIDVGCEACHGPASNHIAWSELKEEGGEYKSLKNKGFSIAFNERKNVEWVMNAKTGSALRAQKKTTNIEIETCAQCHSRRGTTRHGARPGDALLDNFKVSLLTEPLYYDDGQIDGEVYVYGSFVQSKMFHAGVTCSDCHEPHSIKLRAEGNNLCVKCHLPEKYNTEQHHLHKENTDGAQCVSCHMPEKTYMVVDPRRDHSMRIPRPDLSVRISTPNACNNCHTDKSAQWAADVLAKKYGTPDKPHYAEALHAGRQGLPGAEKLLSQLILDESQPAIARATAVTLLPPYLSRESASVLQLAANDKQPLVGFGLANTLDTIAQQHRLPFAIPLLYDDMRSTRILAASSLTGSSLQGSGAEVAARFKESIDEYVKSELFNADRPESLVNLANYYAQTGDRQKAKKLYQQAISTAPYFVPAYLYLADLYRALNDDAAGVELLQKSLSKVRDKAAIQHALGLVFVRQKKLPQAVNYLRLAAESPVSNERYIYVYAIALNSTGKAEEAVDVLEEAYKKFPRSVDIVNALVSINREIGDESKANQYEKILH